MRPQRVLEQVMALMHVAVQDLELGSSEGGSGRPWVPWDASDVVVQPCCLRVAARSLQTDSRAVCGLVPIALPTCLASCALPVLRRFCIAPMDVGALCRGPRPLV
jgi:hypothetical protein